MYEGEMRMNDSSNSSKLFYHATTSKHEKSVRRRIDLRKCNPYTDFGKGFYLTSNLEQAVAHAKRRAKRRKYGVKKESKKFDPVIFIFEVDWDRLKRKRLKVFPEKDLEWAEFIYKCRSERYKGRHSYSAVYGGVADGAIGDLVDTLDKLPKSLYDDGLKSFHKEITKAYSDYDQLSIHNLRLFKYNVIKLVKVVHKDDFGDETVIKTIL